MDNDLLLLGQWRDTTGLNGDSIDPEKIATYNDIWGYVGEDGREYAILHAGKGFYFVEVSEPDRPVLRDYVQLREENIIWRDAKAKGNYLYAVGDVFPSKLTVMDLSALPDSVRIIFNDSNEAVRCHNLFVEGDRLYLFSHRRMNELSFIERHFMSIYDISNPEKPSYIRSLNFPYLSGEVHDGYVKNDTAYLSCGYFGLHVLDLKDLENPRKLWEYTLYPEAGYNHNVWLAQDGNTIVFTDEVPTHLPFKIITVDKDPFFSETSFDTLSIRNRATPHNALFDGQDIYISYYHEGVGKFSPDSTGSYFLSGHYDTYPDNDSAFENGETEELFPGYRGCWGVYPFLPSGTILASDITYGLFVLRDLEKTEKLGENTIDVKLYPNPAKGSFTLFLNDTLLGEEAKVELFDMHGKKVQELTLFSLSHTEVSPSLPIGLYFLKISYRGNTIIKRLAWEGK